MSFLAGVLRRNHLSGRSLLSRVSSTPDSACSSPPLADEREPDEIALSGVAWAEGGRSKKASRQETLLAKFGREGAVQIPLSRMLKTIEQRILAEPKHPSGWRMQINLDTAEPPSEVGLTLPSSAAMASFLAAREEMFAAVRKDTAELIMQGLSFRDAEKECLGLCRSLPRPGSKPHRQAETTSGAERQQHLQALRNVLAVDSIHVILTDFRGRHREAVLVSPTHPLRALWLSSWVALGKDWIEKIKAGGKRSHPACQVCSFGWASALGISSRSSCRGWAHFYPGRQPECFLGIVRADDGGKLTRPDGGNLLRSWPG